MSGRVLHGPWQQFTERLDRLEKVITDMQTVQLVGSILDTFSLLPKGSEGPWAASRAKLLEALPEELQKPIRERLAEGLVEGVVERRRSASTKERERPRLRLVPDDGEGDAS